MSNDSGVVNLKRLIDIGKDKGYITYEELNNDLPNNIVSSEYIDDVMMMFEELDIMVIDEASKNEIEKSKKKVLSWLRNESLPEPPFYVAPTAEAPSGHSWGEKCRDIDLAIDDCIAQVHYQLENGPENDFFPCFDLSFLGEGVIPSMFGAEQLIQEDVPPFTIVGGVPARVIKERT